ncbi:MAG: hypothetical protein R3D29_13960 [Nitratireductor sp.]
MIKLQNCVRFASKKERLQADLSLPPLPPKAGAAAAIAARAALAAEKVKPVAAKKVIFSKVLKYKLAKEKATTAKPAKTTCKAKSPK